MSNSKNIITGGISILRRYDDKVLEIFTGVITEEGSAKYKLVCSDKFLTENDKVVEVIDYHQLDEFDDISEAKESVITAMIALEEAIRDSLKEAGQKVGHSKICFADVC